MKHTIHICLIIFVLVATGVAEAGGENGKVGLSRDARAEIKASGMDKYLGQFTPASETDVGDGWLKHTYAPNFFGDGPMCIKFLLFRIF